MAESGKTLKLPGGTTFEVAVSTADSDGERIEFEITMPPGAMGPPRHYHPTQQESWHVVSGELSVEIDGEWRALDAGESLSVPPDTVHTLRNRSTEAVRFRDVHEPALDFQDYIESLARLTAAGHLSDRMTPKGMIYGSMVLRDHRTTQLSASAVQRAGESALAAIGRALRLDA
jgi:quercetin dioxygenase-like cupin family protein